MDPKRSAVMARIRGRNTQPEVMLRKVLWHRGLRYRVDWKTSAGRADIAFPGRRIAVFIDGCFWHGCPDHYVRPRSRGEFWARKLRENVDRDRCQTLALEEAGWVVVRLWEHDVRQDTERAADVVEGALTPDSDAPRPTLTSWRVVRVTEINPGENLECREMERLRRPLVREAVVKRRSTSKGW